MSKTILYDLETSRTRVEGYGNRWDFKVVKFIKQSELMCYSWKELGENVSTLYHGTIVVVGVRKRQLKRKEGL